MSRTRSLRGSGAFGAKGGFYDDLAVSSKLVAAKALHDYVLLHGGEVEASKLSGFYRQQRHLKSVIGGDLKGLCTKYPHLLTFLPDSRCGRVVCTEVATMPMQTQDQALTLVEALVGFVTWSGGLVHGSHLVRFYEKFPNAQEHLQGRTREFCEQHPDLLRFENNHIMLAPGVKEPPASSSPARHTGNKQANLSPPLSDVNVELDASRQLEIVAMEPQQAAKLMAESAAKSGSSMPSSQVSPALHSTAVLEPVRIKEPELERIALLWKQHLDSRSSLIGNAKVLRSAYLEFCQGMSAPPDFEEVMAELRALGHWRQGTWAKWKWKRTQPDATGAAGSDRDRAEADDRNPEGHGDGGHASTIVAGAQPDDPWDLGHDPWSWPVQGRELHKETLDDCSDNSTERLETMHEVQPKKIDSASLSVDSASSTACTASHFSSAILGAKTALEEVESLAASVQHMEEVLAAKRAELSQLEARERRVAARERALDAKQEALEDLRRELLGAREEACLRAGMEKHSTCASKLGAEYALH